MTEPPRRLPLTQEQRVKVLATRMSPGSYGGSTQFAKPVTPNTRPATRAVAGSPAALASDPVVIGVGATADHFGSVAIGNGADDSGHPYQIGIGNSALVSGDSAIAIGAVANAVGASSVALGPGATTPGEKAVALGRIAEADGLSSVALGDEAVAPNDYDFMLGTALHAVQIPGTFALTSNGATPVGPQPTPATLADVIAILQAFGLSL